MIITNCLPILFCICCKWVNWWLNFIFWLYTQLHIIPESFALSFLTSWPKIHFFISWNTTVGTYLPSSLSSYANIILFVNFFFFLNINLVIEIIYDHDINYHNVYYIFIYQTWTVQCLVIIFGLVLVSYLQLILFLFTRIKSH